MIKAIKLFDTSREEMDMEDAINLWLADNAHIEVISTNLVWDESNLVYSVLYSKESIEAAGS
jgi:hypothetical protein